MASDLYPQIYACIQAIPCGSVATYGQIAEIVHCGPRQVGYALSSLPKDTTLPWHRVVNREGSISVRASDGHCLQREKLEQEGVEFNLKGRIDLAQSQWCP